MTKPLDNLPDELVLQLSRERLGPEVIRLRNIVKDYQRANRSKRNKIHELRRILRHKHSQIRNLVAKLRDTSMYT